MIKIFTHCIKFSPLFLLKKFSMKNLPDPRFQTDFTSSNTPRKLFYEKPYVFMETCGMKDDFMARPGVYPREPPSNLYSFVSRKTFKPELKE